MANILLTTYCNRSCKYCFAKEKLHQKGQQEISMQNLQKVINFLKQSNFTMFRMMGGEPTLHSKFRQIVKQVLSEGFTIDLLSNGLWKKEHAALFDRISPEYIRFLLNIDHPSTYSQKQWDTICENLNRLKSKKKVSLSFNIFEKEPKAEYMVDLAKNYNIETIRLSFSMPLYNKTANSHLQLEDYTLLADWLMNFIKYTESLKLKVGLDNTVPVCMFTKEQIGELVLQGAIEPNRNFKCQTVVDIGPDLSIWRCFGTSEYFNAHLEQFNNLMEIRDYFEEKFDKYQNKIFPMEKCKDCKYALNNTCQGGCIGYTLAQQKEKPPKQELFEQNGLYSKRFVISEGTKIAKYSLPRETMVLSSQNNSTDIVINPEIWKLISTFDGKITFDEAINLLNKTNINSNKDPIDGFLFNQTRDAYYSWIKRLVKLGMLQER